MCLSCVTAVLVLYSPVVEAEVVSTRQDLGRKREQALRRNDARRRPLALARAIHAFKIGCSLSSLLMGGSTSMVTPDRALPGRQAKMPVADKHYVLKNSMSDVPAGFKVAVFANGCFCMCLRRARKNCAPRIAIFAASTNHAVYCGNHKNVSFASMPTSLATLAKVPVC